MAMDFLTALGIVLALVGAGSLLLLFVGVLREMRSNQQETRAVKNATPHPNCPMCIFDARPSDRWTPYAYLIGTAEVCADHRAVYDFMAYGVWSPPVAFNYVSGTLDIDPGATQEMDTVAS